MRIEQNRSFMRSAFGKAHKFVSDQVKGVATPPIQKPCPDDAEILDLPEPDDSVALERDLCACIRKRRSRRMFSDEEITLKDLSYLLWATQGLEEVVGDGYASFRTAPSAGARHPFETYLAVNRVEGLVPGVYRYLPDSHKLLVERTGDDFSQDLAALAMGQEFVGGSAVVFFWSCIPYRSEWRYTVEAARISLIDVGHLCQNLYLAVESLNMGTCAIGAYNQDLADTFLDLDGKDEYVVYLAPVGKL